MAFDLSFGRKVYAWRGRHPRAYRFIRWVACLGRESALQRRVLQAAAIKAGDTVLDLGCGQGVNFPWLQSAVGPMGKIIALDDSDQMLARARAVAEVNGWKNVEFVQSDAARMDLADASLDCVVCTFALSAMPGENVAIQRVAAALKPHGRLVVLDAKPFTGVARVINLLVAPFFKYTTNWNYRKDVIGTIRGTFKYVEATEFNGGCNYLVVATKGGSGF